MSIHDKVNKTKNIQEALNIVKEAADNLDDYVSDFDDVELPVVVREAVTSMVTMYGTGFVVHNNVPIDIVKRFCEMINDLSRICYRAGIRDERFRHLN